MGQVASDFTAEYPKTWQDADVKKWMKEAAQSQKTFYMSFQGRQWDEYESDEYELLRVKICYAIYGPPNNAGGDEGNGIEKIEEAYTEEQRKNANIIKKKILEIHNESELSGSNLCVGFVFVMCKQDKNEFYVPVFRVRVERKPNDVSKYIDTSCRVYNSWEDWEKSNVLPMLKYCYPKPGYYTAQNGSYSYDPAKNPVLAYGTSPACDFSSRLMRQFDLASGIGSFASAGVGITALFFPVAAPILLTATVVGTGSAVYGGARSVHRLVDKSSHSESLTDVESILSILSIIAIPAHFATASANSIIQAGARNGRTFTSFIRIGVTILNCTTITLDSSMFFVGLVNLIHKYNNGQLTKLDVLQFSISAFFFTNTLMQPKTANGIIKQAQTNHFHDFQKNLNDAEAERAFEQFVQENNENIYKASHIIRTINKIENPDVFFKSVGRENAHISLGGRKGNTVIINDNVRINPNRVNQLGPEKASEFLNMTKQFRDNLITNKQYNDFMTKFFKQERIGFEMRRQETLQKLAKLFNTDIDGLKNIQINNKKLFNNLKGADIDRLRTVFQDTARNYNKDIVDAAITVASDLKCNNVHDFCSAVELVANEIRGMTKSERATFLKNIQENTNGNRDHFINDIKKDANTANEILKSSKFEFSSDITAAYHYRKHGTEFGDCITMKIYLDTIPKDLFQEQYLFKEVYSQDGTTIVRTYANADGFKFGVLIENSDGSQRIATVFQNQDFFNNWTEKLSAAQKHIAYCRNLKANALPSVVPSLFSIFQEQNIKEMGFVTMFLVHKNGNTTNLNDFKANSDDADRLRRVAEVMAALHD